MSNARMFRTSLLAALLCVLPCLTANRASADPVIVGSSLLLNQAGANQLGAWLGDPSIALTPIFTKVSGDGKGSTAFHTAVDGKGPTFTVIRTTTGAKTVGGYNPVSWSGPGTGTWVMAPASAPTAFIYNLTTGAMQRVQPGAKQTQNDGGFGPWFGGGADLWVDGSLGTLTADWGGTYGSGASNIFGVASSNYQIAAMEVFTVVHTPEPSSLCLLGIGALSLLGRRRRRRA